MRIKVELNSCEEEAQKEFEGVLVQKDESFLMVKVKKHLLRVVHFDDVKAVYRIFKGSLQNIGMDNFRKVRE